jgi:hypothetical protein
MGYTVAGCEDKGEGDAVEESGVGARRGMWTGLWDRPTLEV